MIDTDERALAVEAEELADELEHWGEGLYQGGSAASDYADRIRAIARRLAQPDQSEPVATFVLSEASAGDEWPSGPLQLTPAGQRLPPGEYTLYTHPDRPQAPGEWRPIETAPKAESVLVWNGQAVGEAYFHDSGDGWWWAGSCPTDAYDGRVWEPTHWRPLPTPPSVPGKGGAE